MTKRRQSLVFCVVALCLSFSPLLLIIALSVVLRFTVSDYHFGILKPSLKLKVINQSYLVLKNKKLIRKCILSHREIQNMIKQGKISEEIYNSKLNDSTLLSKKDVIYNVLNLTIQYTQYEI